MIGDYAKRLKKLEKTNEVMDHIIVATTVNGKQLAQEELIAIDLGIRAGFVAAKVTAEGKCDDMSPLEIATRAYDSAFGIYIENVVLPDMEKAAGEPEKPESEGEHGEE